MWRADSVTDAQDENLKDVYYGWQIKPETLLSGAVSADSMMNEVADEMDQYLRTSGRENDDGFGESVDRTISLVSAQLRRDSAFARTKAKDAVTRPSGQLITPPGVEAAA